MTDRAVPLPQDLPYPGAAALRALFQRSHDAVLVCSATQEIVAVNPACCQLTGYRADELIGRPADLFVAVQDNGNYYRTVHEALARTAFWEGEIWGRRKDGSLFSKWLTLARVDDPAGSDEHLAIFTDISQRHEAAERLVHLAYHDALTRLPNRLAFESQLDLSLKSCERDGQQVALLLIDLDNFKNINDTLGHHVGDELLKAVANRLRESVRASDIVARLGGDEFTVVLPDIDSALVAASLASKIQRNLAGSYQVGEHVLYATPSIGISVFPSDGRDCSTLLRNADTAMYHAKAAGRNNYQFYSARMNEAAGERLQLENALRQAVGELSPERCQFSLHFQPQYHVGSGRIVGLEALARWRHPQLGDVPPSRFIAIAEETGLIQPFGDWVFWETCRQVRRMRDLGLVDIRVAVNISAQQLRHENLPPVVRGALACYDLQPSDIELEITESTAMQNPDMTLAILNELSDMGIVLAIDDFGTGYSSLAYLKQLPIHRLKLDRSFVKDIGCDSSSAAICSATVALGHNLGLEMVAEGVETAEQRDFLAGLHCDVLQGFLYSRPLPADDVIEFLHAFPSPA